MFESKKDYRTYAKARAAKSKSGKNCALAFISGGSVCVLGECFFDIYKNFIDEKTAQTLVSVTLIFIAALLTSLGIFDKIAKHAGAGTLVPITGFSNAMTSPALDTKSEGYIMGVGAKMFTVAGPVIVYGVVASVIYGVVYWICSIL